MNQQITIELTKSAKEFIADQAYDPIYGARPLKRYLQKNVETLSARLILSDQLKPEDTILIDVENDNLIARVK
jgi:ATP-dependent Clp protease ATP-binding subunit ClpB